MKRIEISHPSTIDGLTFVERDIVRPGPGELLVRIRASSLNFHDYLVVAGIFKATAGRVPLSDGVGEVVETGDGVDRFKAGDRVMGTYFHNWLGGPVDATKVAEMRGDHVDGFAAEYVTVRCEDVTRAPASLTDEQAATLPCAALTAWRALFVESSVGEGDTVLIEGTGGVSLFGLQLARMVGAKVIALSSTEEKLEKLRGLGASHVVNYAENPVWGTTVRELAGSSGVDVTLEVVGGDLGQTLAATRVGGRICLIGALSRKPITFPSLPAIAGNITISGLTVASRADQDNMVEAIDAHGLKPVIDRTYHLDEIKAAFHYQETKSYFGKIALQW